MQNQYSSYVAPLALLIGVTACAPRPTLEPAPGALPAPGPEGGATATVAGVALSAWPEQWRGDPSGLPEHATPLLVRIENEGTSEILIRFEHFELRDPAGSDFDAIPPFELDETVVEPATITPRYPVNGFRVAPHLRGLYPRLSPFDRPFALNRAYWARHRTAWVEVDLPTADMVQMALPEGVLEPGGVITGFVYFERVTDDPARLSLGFRLLTPDDEVLGRVQIPFVVRTAP